MFRFFKIICAAAVLLLNSYSMGDVCAAEGIPAPANTQEVRRERRAIAGSEFTTIQYESNLNAEQVSRFYRKALPDDGWQENDILASIEKIPGVKLEEETKKSLKEDLHFEKSGEILTVIFTGAKPGGNKKTGYAISYGRLPAPGQGGNEMDFIPRLLDKPQKEPAPVYPGAALISFTEGENFLRAAYAGQDDMETVEKFYRKNMPQYGWTIKDESALADVTAPTEEDILKSCPSCAKKGIKVPNMDMQEKSLVFIGEQGELCRIGLFAVHISGTEQLAAKAFTNIMVDYEKK